MSGIGKVRKVFPGGNTTYGFYSFYEYILSQEEAARIFVIKGGPGVGKSTFMTKIGTDMVNRGYDVEHLHCSSDNDSLDGLLIPSLKVALIDGTAPHVVDPKNPGAVDEIINLGEYWNDEKIVSAKEQVLKVNSRTGKYFKTSYSLLKEAKVAYDECKGYVGESIDKSKYNEIVRVLLGDIFADASVSYKSVPKARHLFASAITPGGLKNYIETLIPEGTNVYTLEGEPGSGVKELISRISQAAWEMGMFTEQFHCPIEPECVDMVLIPEINTAVLNTSKPFHFNIAEIKGIVLKKSIDLNCCIKDSILDDYKVEFDDAKERFNSLLVKAVEYISKAKALHDTMEEYYVSSMDFNKINEKREETLARILKYASK